MNWVNSSLQLAGTLLESVDQHAALTLSGPGAGERDDDNDGGGGGGGVLGDGTESGLLSSLKKGMARATQQQHTPQGHDDDGVDEEQELEDGDDDRGHGNDDDDGGDGGDGDHDADAAMGATPGPATPRSSTSAASSGAALSRVTSMDRLQQPAPSPSSSMATPPGSGSARKSSATGASRSPSTTDEPLVRLKKENARLRADLRIKDKLLATSQQSVRVYEEEVEALERECKDKMAELQAQLAQLRTDKDADERNFVQALELKDAQLQTAQAELRAMERAEAEHVTALADLRAELTRAEESKDSLWTNAASATQESEAVMTSLRTELEETHASLNTVKREYHDTKMTMFARQSQLEKTNAELSSTVARLERELAKAKELGNASTAITHAPTATGGGPTTALTQQLQEDHRKLQQTLMLTKKNLHDEIRKSEIQRQEIASLSEEVRRLKDAAAGAQGEAAAQVLALTKANAELTEQLQVAQQRDATWGRTQSTEHEARIQTLTNRLLEKQETVDALRSKVTTLETRLADAQGRCQGAEERLAQIERNGGVAALDMELGTPVGSRKGAHLQPRARGTNRMAHAISRVAPVVERSRRVVTALDVLDRWLLFLGRVFLTMPLARLALVAYVALIHFWVFVVLSFHTSHLNEELHNAPPPAAGAAAAVGPHGLFGPEHLPDGMQVPP